jgi:hypothetical protein
MTCPGPAIHQGRLVAVSDLGVIDPDKSDADSGYSSPGLYRNSIPFG